MSSANTRNKDKLDIPLYNSASGQRTFHYRAVSIWNELPNHIKDCRCGFTVVLVAPAGNIYQHFVLVYSFISIVLILTNQYNTVQKRCDEFHAVLPCIASSSFNNQTRIIIKSLAKN